MSGAEPSHSRSTGDREGLDHDDHDILTFGEVGERLRLEIARRPGSRAQRFVFAICVPRLGATRHSRSMTRTLRTSSAIPAGPVNLPSQDSTS